jgi:hypothetical protein
MFKNEKNIYNIPDNMSQCPPKLHCCIAVLMAVGLVIASSSVSTPAMAKEDKQKLCEKDQRIHDKFGLFSHQDVQFHTHEAAKHGFPFSFFLNGGCSG